MPNMPRPTPRIPATSAMPEKITARNMSPSRRGGDVPPLGAEGGRSPFVWRGDSVGTRAGPSVVVMVPSSEFGAGATRVGGPPP